VVTFSYIDSGFETQSGFLTHLAAYQRIFRQLPTFRFLYIAAKDAYFQMAQQRFRSLVNRPLESDTSAEILRYFHIRKKWENHEYVVPVTTDFEFLTGARQRFHGPQMDRLYQAWRCGELSEHELRVEFLRLWPERPIFFDTCVIPSSVTLRHSQRNSVGPELVAQTKVPTFASGHRHPGATR
jgi:hypothetical protein